MCVILAVKDGFKKELKKIWLNETLLIKPAYPELYTVANGRLREEFLNCGSHATAILTIYIPGLTPNNCGKNASWNLKIYQLGKVIKDSIESLDSTLREEEKSTPEFAFYNDLLNVASEKRELTYSSEHTMGLHLENFIDGRVNLDMQEVWIEKANVQHDVEYTPDPRCLNNPRKGYSIINLSIKSTSDSQIFRLSYPNLALFDEELTGDRSRYPIDSKELGIREGDREAFSKIQFNSREYYSIQGKQRIRQEIEKCMSDKERNELEKEIMLDGVLADLTIAGRPYYFYYDREGDSSEFIASQPNRILWHEWGLNSRFAKVTSIFPMDFPRLGTSKTEPIYVGKNKFKMGLPSFLWVKTSKYPTLKAL